MSAIPSMVSLSNHNSPRCGVGRSSGMMEYWWMRLKRATPTLHSGERANLQTLS